MVKFTARRTAARSSPVVAESRRECLGPTVLLRRDPAGGVPPLCGRACRRPRTQHVKSVGVAIVGRIGCRRGVEVRRVFMPANTFLPVPFSTVSRWPRNRRPPTARRAPCDRPWQSAQGCQGKRSIALRVAHPFLEGKSHETGEPERSRRHPDQRIRRHSDGVAGASVTDDDTTTFSANGARRRQYVGGARWWRKSRALNR